MVRVTTGARLHFGFQNLSLAHRRLYGGVGVALAEPRVVVEADAADRVRVTAAAADPAAEGAVAEYARRAADLLGVSGAAVTVRERIPRHVGLGSGTQLALATLAAVARAHGRPVRARERAPALGRGGRSGVGVAGFERGGFVVDAGHPTARFTPERPADGEWTVPAVAVRHALPADWRFVVAVPEGTVGRSGEDEDASMRAAVERADPAVADDIAAVVVRRLLPAAAEGVRRAFGAAVAELGRLNGTWYADQQGGVYRPPADALVEALRDCPAVSGAGQSSWGPAVYGLADERGAGEAAAVAREALDEIDAGGTVFVAPPRNEGATIRD